MSRKKETSICCPSLSSLLASAKIICAFLFRSPPSLDIRVKRRLYLSLSLGLSGLLAPDTATLKDSLAVFIELKLGNNYVTRVDAEGDALAVSLFAGYAFDVNYVFKTVYRGNLALFIFISTADDYNLVVLTDGDTTDLGGVSF
jgi:hypothetical protein